MPKRVRISIRMTLTAVLSAVAAMIAAAGASAATFTNATPITAPSAAVGATPYPSTISVSGMSGPITDVNVRLHGFGGTLPDATGVVLAAPFESAVFPPSPSALLLMNEVGGGADVAGLSLNFDDSAASFAPDEPSPLLGGTYKPTQHSLIHQSYPSPAPKYGDPGPSGLGSATLASEFARPGSTADGVWSLYFRNYSFADSAQITGGWSLEIVTAPSKKKCKKKGKKKSKRAAAAKRKKCKKKRK